MAEQTNDLKLFKYNTATDGKEVFSIERSMNENWDKIDAFSSAIKSLSNLDAVGEKRFTDINTELSKKLEAEVLLAENGYIKFNNGLLINWLQTNNSKVFNFACSYNSQIYCVVLTTTATSTTAWFSVISKSLTGITTTAFWNGTHWPEHSYTLVLGI